MKLNIKLRDGFADDNVKISVDDKVVFERSGVTSDPTISFADAADIETEQESVTVKVAVVGEPAEQKTIDLNKTPFVEIWRSENGLDVRASEREIPML